MSRRPYIRPVSKTTWYMRKGRYIRYMLREVTCILVGLYSFLLIWGLYALGKGPQAWSDFLACQQNTVVAVLHAVALVFFLVYQTFDWFKLAPKAMPVQLGESRVPDQVIVAAHYIVWVAVTAIIFWLLGVI